ncbi:hypothetical protein TrVE_jg6745 [Triparma verrucosa]|uniref:Calmodulin n=1 Tax=Triparma verrucosa TaxID=1606542 RepID=A0A9W7BJT9_9STRA|nr:hypothetical protein TrVE_jg6745 [Triparma verrucosa]
MSTLSECKLLGAYDIGSTTSSCCTRINTLAGQLIASTLPTSAYGASVPQCKNDETQCYDATVYALQQSEDSFGQENMVSPFVGACADLMSGEAFPPQLDCDASADDSNSTNSSIYLEPTCTPCSRLNGFYMSENGFVNISDYLGIERVHDPSQACAAGYQCVSKDPFDAIPASESEIFSKAGGCCQKCLNGQTCPPMTVGGSGYYFDNLCPDGHRCDEGEWPTECVPGEICSKGIVLNCTEVASSARRPTWQNTNATNDNGDNNTDAVSGMFDGAYCDGGASLGWCPGGFYCPEPDHMIECPVGYFCPPKSRTFQFKCADTKCGPGAIYDHPQTKFQVMTAIVLAILTCIVLLSIWLNTILNKEYERMRFEARRIESAQQDFLMEELMELRRANELEAEDPSKGKILEKAATMATSRMARATANPSKTNRFSNMVNLNTIRNSLIGGSGERARLARKSARERSKSEKERRSTSGSNMSSIMPVVSPDVEQPAALPKIQRSKDPAEPQQTPSSTVGSPESSNSKVKFADKEEEEENIALPTYEEIKTIFESMDKDGDGLISFAELKATRLGQAMSEEDLKKIMMKSHRTNDSNIQSLTSQRGRKGSIFGGFKNMLAGTGDTGRGKDAMAAMLGAGAEALPAKSEEEQRKFFEDLKRQSASGDKDKKEVVGTASKSVKQGAEIRSSTKAPTRPNMQRRGSFMNKIEVAAGGIGRQASASTGALQGITFEDFAEEYFAMMLNKQNEDIDDDPSIKGVEVRFENLSLTVNVGGKEMTVLNNISGTIKEKTMVALMGGSGAGKTSLLNALCGRAWYGKVTGDVYINGVKDRMENHQDILGFVPQDDIVHPDLTVYENLMYSGLFRLPKGTPLWEIDDLAYQVLTELQIDNVADSLVGDAGKRGISGGQRKRVNIGLELMARPKLLFLDEPTSGLDANSSQVALTALKKLAKRRGTTVVTVIHQPRYQIFKMFDSVTLLAVGGHVVFQGAPTINVDYFKSIGYQLPFGENPADWMLDISSGTAKPTLSTSSSLLKTTGNRRKTETLPTSAKGRIDRLITKWKVSTRISDGITRKSSNLDVALKVGFHEKVNRVGFLRQYWLFIRRLLKQRFRRFKTILLDMILVVGSAYLAANVSGPFVPIIEEDEVIAVPAEVIMNITIPGAEREEYPVPVLKSFEKANEYAMISNLLFVILVTLSALRSFGDGKLLFFREASSGYNVTAYFWAQLTLDQVFHSLQAFWTAVVSYELRTSLGPIMSYVVLYQLTAFFCTGWAYVFSMVVPRENLVMTSALFVSVCGTLLSGSLTFLKFEDIYANDGLGVLVGTMSSTRWFTEWIIVSEFKALPAQYGYTDDTLNYFEKGGYGLDDIDNARAMGNKGWYYNCWPLIGMGVALRVVAYGLIMLLDRQKCNKKALSRFGCLDWCWFLGMLGLMFVFVAVGVGCVLRAMVEDALL